MNQVPLIVARREIDRRKRTRGDLAIDRHGECRYYERAISFRFHRKGNARSGVKIIAATKEKIASIENELGFTSICLTDVMLQGLHFLFYVPQMNVAPFSTWAIKEVNNSTGQTTNQD